MRYDTLLIDGSHLAFRAFHTHKDFGVKIGGKFVGTGIAFGSLNSILGIIKDRMIKDDPEIIIAWDRGRNRRTAVYPQYKGNRDQEWDEYENFSAQRKVFQRIAPLAGMVQAWKNGEEADDIVGTLSKTKSAQGKSVLILTGDHDYFQLVDDRCHVLRPKKKGDILYDNARIKEEFGVTPDRFVHIMSLMGDPGDNIPGIRGVAEKTAIKLLTEDPEIVVKCLNSDEPDINIKSNTMRDKILENIFEIRLANKLTLMATDITEINYVKRKRNPRELKRMLEMLKCHSLLEGEKWNTLLRLV